MMPSQSPVLRGALRSIRNLSLPLALCSLTSLAQTSSTGAIKGVVKDADDAAIASASITATSAATGEKRVASTSTEGQFSVPLLSPGEYMVLVTKDGFGSKKFEHVVINVTETQTLNPILTVGSVSTSIEVGTVLQGVDAASSVVGNVVTPQEVVGLPLVNRNYTQILTLAAGVTSDVTNAGELGRGSGGTSPTAAGGGTFTHGDRAYDNDFQINGLQVNDIMAQGATSGGIPIPNPDTILEFKLQTAQYDAAFGRRAGGNVALVTRTGSAQFHGTLFEFFRNTALNANQYFLKRNGQARPILNQNQFGGTLGGPIVPHKLTFFGAYQGTRQKNGVSSLATVLMPAFTTDRSATALGSLFAGRRGALQGSAGPAIAADGSNINPAALRILQAKLPDGSYVIPTPQTITGSSSADTRGSSTFSTPSTFNENQYMGNTAYTINDAQHIAANLFLAKSNQSVSLPNSNVPGYPNTSGNTFLVSSVQHSWILTSNLVSDFRIGYNRFITDTTQVIPYKFSDFGISAPTQLDPYLSFTIVGSVKFGTQAPGKRVANIFLLDEAVAYSHGRNGFRFGFGGARFQRNFEHQTTPGTLVLMSFPDLLLGLSAAQNGSAFSNIYQSVQLDALFDRKTEFWEGYGYAQDDYRIHPRLTINAGLRYDWLPGATDGMGRASNVNVSQLNRNPGSASTYDGVTVASNYSGATPTGVVRHSGNGIYDGTGQNSFGPRVGFSWKLFPNSDKAVLRGGYGIYYSRIIGQVLTQGTTTQPFGRLSSRAGTAAATASLANPFLTAAVLPGFTPYSSSTSFSATAVDPAIRPGIVQQLSLGTQTEISNGLVLDITTVQTRGNHLLATYGINQASIATTSAPIWGVTTTTISNTASRAPYQGWGVTGLTQVQSSDNSWYSDLEATLTKRFVSGSQIQAAYTWSKTLDGEAANVVETAVGTATAIGDQFVKRGRYGAAPFSRPQRLVVSYVYELPFFRHANGWTKDSLGGWQVSGVTIVQSGNPLTPVGTNSNNATGITSDRAQMATGCTGGMLGRQGSVQSKISSFFNTACVGPTIPYRVIGSDGVATAFGNGPISAVRGPSQNNWDISLIKNFHMDDRYIKNIEFRSEFFNAFNTPQFGNPNLTATSSSFGSITATTVAPRIIQFALKAEF